MATTSVLASANWPRVYRVDTTTRYWTIGICAVLTAFFLALAARQYFHFADPSLPLGEFIIVNFVFLILSVLLIFESSKRVTLTEDSIELASWIGSRKIKRSEICGRREAQIPIRSGEGAFTRLVTTEDKVSRLPTFLEWDEVSNAWMVEIPILEE